MAKLLIALATTVALVAPAHARPRSAFCEGLWSDTRGAGMMIDDCDLNFISDKDLEWIKLGCGEPGNISSDEQSSCAIRALIVPSTNRRGAKVRKVLKVLNVIGTD
jgi:hypothetical protein